MNTRSPRATTRGFDTTHFRHALSQFATGVTVITTRLADGSFRGLTASSFNSVSLDPPLVLWSLRRSENPFADVDFELSRTGLPILKGVSAWFECHNRSRYPEGDHVIFVGEVEQCQVHPQPALIFHGGKFASTPQR